MRNILGVLLMFCCSLSFAQEKKLNSKSVDDFNYKLYSYCYLLELQSLFNESNHLIASWVFIDKSPNTPDKLKLTQIHDKLIPQKLSQLDYLATYWTFSEKEIYQEIKDESLKMKELQKYIMKKLNNFDAYDDLMVLFEVIPMVEDGGEAVVIYKDIEIKLDVFKEHFFNQFNAYLPRLPIHEEISVLVIDPKMILIEMFISKYNLKKYVENESDYKKIYDIYTLKELKSILSGSVKDEIEFYDKYNNLVIELNK